MVKTSQNGRSLTAGESDKRFATIGTILGFMLFLSGALLLIYGFLDIVVRIESLKTAGYLLIGYVMFKLGQAIMKHFAVFKVDHERRRMPRE